MTEKQGQELVTILKRINGTLWIMNFLILVVANVLLSIVL